MNQQISDLIKTPYFLAYIGAIVGHILSLYAKDFKGSIPFLEHMIPGKQPVFYYRLDFIILPIIGAILANILMEPTNLRPPIFAGLSWTATLAALLKKQTP